jgi:hypothetical protein
MCIQAHGVVSGLVFVFVCPALAAVRTHYAPLFALRSRTLRAFVWQPDLLLLWSKPYSVLALPMPQSSPLPPPETKTAMQLQVCTWKLPRRSQVGNQNVDTTGLPWSKTRHFLLIPLLPLNALPNAAHECGCQMCGPPVARDLSAVVWLSATVGSVFREDAHGWPPTLYSARIPGNARLGLRRIMLS